MDPSTEDKNLKTRITKQIEYYFSDVNLVRDKFMQEELNRNQNHIKISTLLTFSRLAKLTKSEDLIVAALKDSESDLIEVDESAKTVRRKKPLPGKECEKEFSARTLHISGFPDSLEFDDLHRFCSKLGEVESLSMRQHYKTKQFKGCIHVVFKDAETAQKIHAGEKKFKDRQLRSETMVEYHQRKEEMRVKRMKHKAKKSGEDGEMKAKRMRHKDQEGDEEEEEEETRVKKMKPPVEGDLLQPN